MAWYRRPARLWGSPLWRQLWSYQAVAKPAYPDQLSVGRWLARPGCVGAALLLAAVGLCLAPLSAAPLVASLSSALSVSPSGGLSSGLPLVLVLAVLVLWAPLGPPRRPPYYLPPPPHLLEEFEI